MKVIHQIIFHSFAGIQCQIMKAHAHISIDLVGFMFRTLIIAFHVGFSCLFSTEGNVTVYITVKYPERHIDTGHRADLIGREETFGKEFLAFIVVLNRFSQFIRHNGERYDTVRFQHAGKLLGQNNIVAAVRTGQRSGRLSGCDDLRTAGTADNPMFCLTDICRILDIKNVTDARTRLDQKGLGQTEVLTNGGKQSMYFINEKNLYRLIMRSDKPQAESFQDWVCGEVLPSIRKHGAYMTEQTLEKALTSPDFLIQLATQLKEEKEKRIAAEQESAQKQLVIEEQAPKVVFADAVIGSRSSCLVGELAKIITQNGVKIGQNKLFEWLRNNHYLGCRGEYYNIPYQQYIDMGLFELKKTTHSENGVMKSTVTTKVTGKGQQYFINKFLKDGKD